MSTVQVNVSPTAKTELEKLGIGGDKFLRLIVVSGGCAGMKYGAAIDNKREEGDLTIFEEDGFEVVTSMKFVSYMDGLLIDYSTDLMDAGFIIGNPSASSSCSCGASFG